jgi:Domain of unknown function (DUF4157)
MAATRQQMKTTSLMAANSRTSGFLQRQCACGSHAKVGEQCAECAKKKSALQRKLAIGASNDPLEREADRIADQVMAAPAHSTIEHAPLQIQRFTGHADTESDTVPASVDRVLASSGRPLEPALREDMEQRFGHDFSQVRVHAGDAAGQSAQDVNANAYTVGKNIVFGPSRFTPETYAGRRLLAHELTHVVQQSSAQERVANQRYAHRDSGTSARGRENLPATVHSQSHPILQRDLGFEFQVQSNTLTTNKGQKFGVKSGGFFHRVPPGDKHGLELQTDTGSVLEFQTHHFQKWSELETQIQAAVDIVKDINKDPKAFPFNQESRLQKAGLLKKDEKLEVSVNDPSFKADIQSTEGVALTQYESLLKEHERDPTKYIDPVLKDAQDIVNAAAKASKSIKPGVKLDNLRGFLQIIINYVRRGQEELWDKSAASPVKATVRLMQRTDFSSAFRDLLSADEKTLFKEILKSNAILTAVGIGANDLFFKTGYWGHLGNMYAFFEGGKVAALAPENKTPIHDCSKKTKTPGIDSSECGKSVPDSVITVGGWLNSIVTQTKDALSPPFRGSVSMGKFPVASKGTEKGLVVVEARGYRTRNRLQPASKWLDFAEDVFSEAAVCRARPGTGTELTYGGKKPFDPKKCP